MLFIDCNMQTQSQKWLQAQIFFLGAPHLSLFLWNTHTHTHTHTYFPLQLASIQDLAVNDNSCLKRPVY